MSPIQLQAKDPARPPYKTNTIPDKDLSPIIDEYVQQAKDNDVTPTQVGLCKHLGMCEESFYRIIEDKSRPQLAKSLKYAKMAIKEAVHSRALNNKINATYAIWYGKQTFGERDERYLESTSHVKHSIIEQIRAAGDDAIDVTPLPPSLADGDGTADGSSA